MKKSLFWSLIAATAMMTACSDDAFVDNQQVVTGEETPVAFKINMGECDQYLCRYGFLKRRMVELERFRH